LLKFFSLKIEVAIDNVNAAIAADQNGASRLELCANLNEGGTTPSFGMIQAVCAAVEIPVFTMIRPRAGDFIYTDSEFEVMLRDIEAAARAGSNGVVFGILNPQGWIDISRTRELVSVARSHNLHITFHRAFDVCNDPIAALEALCEMQFDNLLTSGQQPTADLGISQLKDLVQIARGRINIMAGSGVNPENALEIAQCGVDALHFTARKRVVENDQFSFGDTWKFDDEKVRKIVAYWS
jgi:copper homeostasis protein